LARNIEAEIIDQGKVQLRSLEIAGIVVLRLSELSELAARRFSVNYSRENGESMLEPVSDQVTSPLGEDQLQYFLFPDPEKR
jgi:transcriptional regulator NrdR family protein